MERYHLLYKPSKTAIGAKTLQEESALSAYRIKWCSNSMKWACVNALVNGTILGSASLISVNLGSYARNTEFATEIRHVSGGTMLILFTKDLFPKLYNRDETGKITTYLWVSNTLGFSLCVLTMALINGNLVKKSTQSLTIINPVDSIGFFVDVIFDGVLVGFTASKSRCDFVKSLPLTLVLCIDNVIDGLAIGSDVDDSVFVYAILFFITAILSAQIAIFIRAIWFTNNMIANSMYGLLTGFASTTVLISGLELIDQGLTLWVGLGCLIAWATLHVVERVEASSEK